MNIDLNPAPVTYAAAVGGVEGLVAALKNLGIYWQKFCTFYKGGSLRAEGEAISPPRRRGLRSLFRTK